VARGLQSLIVNQFYRLSTTWPV